MCVGGWGGELEVSYLYDPDGVRRPSRLLFTECRRIRWDVHNPEDVPEAVRDGAVGVIGFELASESRDHALIHTDTFELAIWYGSYEVVDG